MLKTINSESILNTRLLSILILGFASGLPLALTGTTLQAWFTHAHINLYTIGLITLVGLPYSLKFLWAPLIDHFKLPIPDKMLRIFPGQAFGKRKGWILFMQACLVITLLLIANLEPTQDSYLMCIIALFIAFFSASQDISITAYQVELLTAEERGLGVAYYIFAYRVALLLSGGLALICADYFGWRVTYELMAAFMFLAMVVTFWLPAVQEFTAKGNLFRTIVDSLIDLINRDKIILILLFIVSYKLGDALALSLMTNFLLNGLGFTLTEIGIAFKVVSFVATILGAFIGGILLTRWSLYKALLVFGIAQAFSNLTFAYLAILGKHFSFLVAAMFIENFCSGLSTAALFSFMMFLCNKRFTASQFALLSAIASLGRIFLGPVASLLVIRFGWTQFFMISFLVCFPSMFLLVFLKNKVAVYATEQA